MRTDGNASRVNNRFLQNIIVGDGVKANIKEAITSATGCITKGLKIKHASKRWVEEING